MILLVVVLVLVLGFTAGFEDEDDSPTSPAFNHTISLQDGDFYV